MFSDVPDSLVKAWLRYEMSLVSSIGILSSEHFLELSKLSAAARSARIKSFLQARVTSQTTKLNGLQAQTDAQSSALQDDIDQCNTLIGGL